MPLKYRVEPLKEPTYTIELPKELDGATAVETLREAAKQSKLKTCATYIGIWCSLEYLSIFIPICLKPRGIRGALSSGLHASVSRTYGVQDIEFYSEFPTLIKEEEFEDFRKNFLKLAANIE